MAGIGIGVIEAISPVLFCPQPDYRHTNLPSCLSYNGSGFC